LADWTADANIERRKTLSIHGFKQFVPAKKAKMENALPPSGRVRLFNGIIKTKM